MWPLLATPLNQKLATDEIVAIQAVQHVLPIGAIDAVIMARPDDVHNVAEDLRRGTAYRR